jgi:hypothetical protein
MFERFSHRRRLNELEEAVAKLQRDVSRLDLELTDTLSKLRSLMGRVVKREALAQEREDAMMGISPKGESPSSHPHGPEPVPGSGGNLTPRQREIQQQILRRRAGGS